jgi:hypothetical protein
MTTLPQNWSHQTTKTRWDRRPKMHPEIERLMVREHQNALLEQADAERLASSARRDRPGRVVDCSAPAWRRAVGSAAIELGVWLSGGSIDPASELR